MATPVLIIGKSGTGKSASLRNFHPSEVAVINVMGKPMPFKGNLETVHTDNYREISLLEKDTEKKSIVIDDAGYLITNEFMRGHSATGSGNGIFQFYNKLADDFWKLIEFTKGSGKVSSDKIVYFFMHEDQNDFGNVKPKTIGKLLDEKVCIEGMFTIVLRSVFKDGKYYFKTKTDGFDVCKTPIGMFESDEIDNDLKTVDGKIREYYEI